ncbi:MAG: hypothetical protein NVS3B1_29520 [Marmoricola sp.]
MNLPARIEPVRIWISAPNRCEAWDCPLESRAVVFYMSNGWSQLENRLVCMAHAEQCKRIGRCLVFHLTLAPPVEHVLAAVNAEIQRRQMAARQQQVYQQSFMYGGTGTGTTGSFFNGGSFTIRFG